MPHRTAGHKSAHRKGSTMAKKRVKKAKEPIVYLRGEFVPESKAGIAIYDQGVVLGATITTMTRTFHHQPFRLDDHIARLYRSTKYIRVDVGFGPRKMRELTMRVVEHNAALLPPDGELGIIHFITPGVFTTYAGSAAGSVKLMPTVCIHSFPLPLYMFKKNYTRGAHVVTPSTRHVPPECVDPKMKNRSRLHWFIADGETHQVDPAATSLLLDMNGNITECSGANFLLVNDGAVCSPTPTNILAGISRETVKELCGELGIPFIERDLQVFDVVNADEAFLSSTPYCMVPVTRINNITIGKGKMGPVTRRLLDAWSDRVGLDIVKQAQRSKKPR